MKELFDPKTYADAHVHSPALDEIVVSGVGGSKLQLTFEKKIDGWDVQITVRGRFLDRPEPNHVVLMMGAPTTPEMKQFWTTMMSRARQDTGFDRRTEEAIAILKARTPK